MSTSKPTIGLVASGAMGSAVAHRLTANGYTVLTSLAGRSQGSVLRARNAGMQNVGMNAMVQRSRYVLSILPPASAAEFASEVLECLKLPNGETDTRINDGDRRERERLFFVDCNAISPMAVAELAEKFEQYNTTQPMTAIDFVDASIIGGLPSILGSVPVYDPTFYVSGEKNLVDNVTAVMRDGGLKVTTLDAGVGEASALKMGHSGIDKGLIGLTAAMILATYASSPATAKALMTELGSSQPALFQRMTKLIPELPPKAYRFVREMQDVADFTSHSFASFDTNDADTDLGRSTGDTWRGLSSLFELISISRKMDGEPHRILERVVEDAKKARDNAGGTGRH